MKDNFPAALAALLKHEGGFVNHPKDPGGITNLGVTKKIWEAYVGHEVDEQTMRSLTPSMVAPLYKQRYWDAVKGDDLPSGVDLCVFDCAVNSGAGRASKLLQQAVGVKDDGQIGPATIKAVKDKPVQEVIESFTDKRQHFLESLPTFGDFGKGWTRRVAEVEDQSKRLA
jgi:lysozyme family protein